MFKNTVPGFQITYGTVTHRAQNLRIYIKIMCQMYTKSVELCCKIYQYTLKNHNRYLTHIKITKISFTISQNDVINSKRLTFGM